MGLSAFRTITKVDNPTYVSGDIIPSDLDFSANTPTNNILGTPINTMREIQVQFTTDTPGVLTLTFDGTNFFSVNDDATITGLATLTVFVDNTTMLNFEFSVGAEIILWVGG